MSFNTQLTRLLGIRTPVILPPMAFAAGALLASQVHMAGGFGFLSPTYSGTDAFEREFALARMLLGQPTGALPLGAGFLGWKLDADPAHAALLDVALAHGVRCVWLSFGADLTRWVERVRAHDSTTLVAIQVNSAAEALHAARTWKADIIVAQGIEAGGHGAASAPPLLNLLPQVLRALTVLPAPPPVLAAGGLTSGAHLAAVLALGASGGVFGTRFLATPAALYTPAQKAALLAAPAGAAVRSRAFDALRGTLGWPAGVDGRALAMPAAEAYDGGAPLEDARRVLEDGVRTGDPRAQIVWAGTGVGEVTELQPAKDIVRELHDDAAAHLRASYALLQE
ncbi:2-nitropropane dioxygenase [Auriscalpium vulgare]|uniref:2-nitropropane dioxygenase n=1 Tax=Auriscalpium vulgare TaxID=40419 RepID=A0ACB8RTT1_9AGAM|nr:2-nitropropane dioxygenase [Auriscalpium vulgare]